MLPPKTRSGNTSRVQRTCWPFLRCRISAAIAPQNPFSFLHTLPVNAHSSLSSRSVMAHARDNPLIPSIVLTRNLVSGTPLHFLPGGGLGAASSQKQRRASFPTPRGVQATISASTRSQADIDSIPDEIPHRFRASNSNRPIWLSGPSESLQPLSLYFQIQEALGQYAPLPSSKSSLPNLRDKSPIISLNHVLRAHFYTRRFGPDESPRFPDSKIAIQADSTGLERKIA